MNFVVVSHERLIPTGCLRASLRGTALLIRTHLCKVYLLYNYVHLCKTLTAFIKNKTITKYQWPMVKTSSQLERDIAAELKNEI